MNLNTILKNKEYTVDNIDISIVFTQKQITKIVNTKSLNDLDYLIILRHKTKELYYLSLAKDIMKSDVEYLQYEKLGKVDDLPKDYDAIYIDNILK